MMRFLTGVFLFLYLAIGPVAAAAGWEFRCEVPYALGPSAGVVYPGAALPVLLTIEKDMPLPATVEVAIELEDWLQTPPAKARWQIAGGQMRNQVRLDAGYSQWFDLVSLPVRPDLSPGVYLLRISVNHTVYTYPVSVAAPRPAALTLQAATLPLDESGRPDGRQAADTLVLRDASWDGWQNLLAGRGTVNRNEERLQAVAYAAVQLQNPAGRQAVAQLQAELTDKRHGTALPGLFTPGADGEIGAAGLDVLLAVTGEAQQTVLVPLYIDERLLQEGEYYLRWRLREAGQADVMLEQPVRVVIRHSQALALVALTVGGAALAGSWWLGRLRQYLAAWSVRQVITIAMFGVISFAVAVIPASLLWGFFHIILGPFGSLVTGLFSEVALYALIVTLLYLLPRPGVVSVLALLRFMLGALLFGRLSPVIILSYVLHALLLEGLLWSGRGYDVLAGRMLPGSVWRIAAAGALTEALAGYLGLQAMSLLYRLYYASWYIAMVVLVNGVLYAGLGCWLGQRLGRLLRTLKSD